MNKQFCCIGWGALWCLIGLGLIIMAILIVGVVDDAVDASVKKAIKIEPNYGSWDDEQKNDWINSDKNYTYYAWDLSNLKDLLPVDPDTGLATTPLRNQKLNLVNIKADGFTVRYFDHKYNISWNTTVDTVDYSSWWTQDWASDADRTAETVTARFPNPAYLAAVFSTKNSSALRALGQRETTLYMALGSTTWSTVRANLVDPAKPFQSALRILAIFAYLPGVRAILTSQAGLTSDQVIRQWANNSVYTVLAKDASSAFVGLTGFELRTGNGGSTRSSGLNDYADTVKLWDSTSGTSLTNSSGIFVWLSALQAYSAGGTGYLTNSNFQKLAANYQLTTIPVIFTWLATISNVTDTTVFNRYQTAVVGSTTVQSTAACSGAATFSDVGYCQFGSSFGTQLAGLGDSIVALDPNAAQQCAGLRACCGCVGFEWNAYMKANFPLNITNLALSYSDAKCWLNALANNFTTVASLAYLESQYVTLSGAAGVQYALTNSTIGQACGLNARGRSDFIGKIGNSVNLANAQPGILDYVTQNVIHNFAMVPQVFTKVAPFTASSGLFTKRSPASVMFGYTRGETWQSFNNDFLLYQNKATYGGILSNYTNQDQQWLDSGPFNYREYTGATDLDKVRQYYWWRGATQVQNLADFGRGGFLANSATDAPWCFVSAANPAVLDCKNVWTSPEVVTGSSTGLNFKPFQEKTDPASLNLKIWASLPLLRVANFTYQKDVEVKGIKARRFIIDPNHLLNATNFASNSKYLMKDPTGSATVQGFYRDVPIIVARPAFWQGDPWFMKFVNGLNDTDGFQATDDRFLTYVDVEPITGSTIRGHKRLQYTLKLNSNNFNAPFWQYLFDVAELDPACDSPLQAGVPPGHPLCGKAVYLPAFWADEYGELKDKDASNLKKIYDARDVAEILEIVGYAVGGFFVLCAVLCMAYWIRKPAQDLGLKLESKTTL